MNVLILFTNRNFALNIMRCLADKGIRCHLFGPSGAWEVQLSKYCCGFMACPGKSFAECSPGLIETINQYCSRQNISCIIPAEVITTVFLSQVRERLLPQIKTVAVSEVDTLKVLDNKWEFACLLKKHGLPQPQIFLAENMEQFEAITLPFPRVVKPLSGGGRWAAGGDIGTYVRKNMTDYLTSAQDGKAFPLIVQEFIPGVDIGLNIFAMRGRIVAWTMQKLVKDGLLEFFHSSQLLELGDRLVSEIKFEGLANLDLRIDERDNSLKFIECNPRCWGSLRASMWNGVNFPLIAVNAALGQDASKIASQNIVYVQPSRVLGRLFKGDITALKGLPETTRKDICQIVSDPLSCLYSIYRDMLHNRIHGR